MTSLRFCSLIYTPRTAWLYSGAELWCYHDRDNSRGSSFEPLWLWQWKQYELELSALLEMISSTVSLEISALSTISSSISDDRLLDPIFFVPILSVLVLSVLLRIVERSCCRFVVAQCGPRGKSSARGRVIYDMRANKRRSLHTTQLCSRPLPCRVWASKSLKNIQKI